MQWLVSPSLSFSKGLHFRSHSAVELFFFKKKNSIIVKLPHETHKKLPYCLSAKGGEVFCISVKEVRHPTCVLYFLNITMFGQVYNALGVSYVREGKLDKGISQFETAVKLQPGYVTAWNNLGDAYEKKKDLKSALKAFEEVLLFDPNNKVARPRRDALKDRVPLYKGVPVKSKDR